MFCLPRRATTINMRKLCFCLVVCCVFQLTHQEQIAMKIVEEPSSYGWNNMWDQRQMQETTGTKLTMRVFPANFTGPKHLKKLLHKCFELDDVTYSYELCHFSNITQREKSIRWNPYHGILGVYQEWEIENNTFTAISYREGDRCGTSFRRARVLFKCGKKNELVNVTEPSTCHYELTFLSPYVCHPHSMLVYPTLDKDLQTAWDQLEGALYEEEITQQGYKKKLAKIFESAGYYLSVSKKKELAKKAKNEEKHKDSGGKGEFETLSKCSEEYNKLKNEVEGLRTLLALHNPNDDSENINISLNNNASQTSDSPKH